MVLNYSVLYCTVLCYVINGMACYVILYCTVYCIVLFYIVLCCKVSYCVMPRLYFIVLHLIVLY